MLLISLLLLFYLFFFSSCLFLLTFFLLSISPHELHINLLPFCSVGSLHVTNDDHDSMNDDLHDKCMPTV